MGNVSVWRRPGMAFAVCLWILALVSSVGAQVQEHVAEARERQGRREELTVAHAGPRRFARRALDFPEDSEGQHCQRRHAQRLEHDAAGKRLNTSRGEVGGTTPDRQQQEPLVQHAEVPQTTEGQDVQPALISLFRPTQRLASDRRRGSSSSRRASPTRL